MDTIAFINRTEFEDDPFAEVDDTSVKADYDVGNVAFVLIISMIKLAICLASISADIFLLVVLFRFGRLWEVRINKYILNLAILNIIYYLAAPLFFIFEHLVYTDYVPTIFLLQTQTTILILYITFAIALAVDWYFSGYVPSLMYNYKIYYHYVFSGIYVVFVIEWIFAFIYAENHHMIRMSIFSVFYVTFLVLLVTINILKCRLSPKEDTTKTAHALTTANIIYAAFLPILIYHLIVRHSSNITVLTIVLYTEFIPSLLEIGHPILVVYMLGRMNKYFKMAYNKSFKRSTRNYGVEENLDDVSEVGGVRNNTIHVTVTEDQRNDKHLLEI
nr:uncharacterized protein LOC111512340 [Leptinotarsa decemlineata]